MPLPVTTYPLWDTLPEEVVRSGLLSRLQLEGVLHACAKHQELLPSGERCGFMIGGWQKQSMRKRGRMCVHV